MDLLRRSIFLLILTEFSLTSSYELKSCCSNESSTKKQLLSCPTNFLIKLRSAIFYTGNGCAVSSCQKRLNKHFLFCNNHRTCSISIDCIPIETSRCASANANSSNLTEYLVIDYDCQMSQNEVLSTKSNENLFLFSAKVNIDSPSDSFIENSTTEQEQKWKEYLIKKYLEENGKGKENLIFVDEPRSLMNDVFRTILILIVFALTLIFVMLIALWIYKRIKVTRHKHRPFPCNFADDAYDNLKTTPGQSISDNGTASDV